VSRLTKNQRFIIGSWNAEKSLFGALVKQPDPNKITTLEAVTAWARDNLTLGEYDVIVVLPGKLEVYKQGELPL